MKLGFTAAVVCLALLASACTKDDNGGGNNGSEDQPNASAFFVSVTGDEDEYIMLLENIESGEASIDQNIDQLEMSGYTWIFNTKPSAAIGFIYNWGDPGIGLGYGVNADSTLRKLGEFRITSRFTSYGFFDHYALASVGGQVLVDDSGNSILDEDGNERKDGMTFNFINLSNISMTDKTIPTLNMVNDDNLQATFSGIVDLGNGTFLTGLVVSTAKDESATGGASTGAVVYPDSCWVAALDGDLNVKHIYRDGRLSYSSGRYRSQYYAQIGKADDGKIYVFSGAYDYNANETSRPAGAIRINSASATDFDPNYLFNIEAKTGGYRFRKVWHITDDYFMLEIYNHTGRVNNIDNPATRYGIVKMEEQTFQWISGIPALDEITDTGLPMAYDGKMYFPITSTGKNPTLYIIDPATAIATAGASIRGASSINAVGRLTDL